ncbi:MAG: hypothetical protein ACK40G_17625 [Cytophagaceae bacterium]
MIHLGKEIEKRVKELNYPVKELAKQLNTSRNNIYNIYSRESIDTALLVKISEVLKYDFFQFFIDQTKYTSEVEDLKKQIELLKKEIEYLKKINVLLEKGVKYKKG